MEKERVLIVSGGSVAIDFAREYLQGEHFDRVIAADAGLGHCREIGIEPTDILGDFDSLKDRELLEVYRKKGIPLREFPTRKDYTDTHLAMLYAIDLAPSCVVVLGATGTRMDHTLANISLLSMMCDAQIPCRIVDKHNEIEMLCGPSERHYKKRAGKTFFSILAFSDEVTGIDEIGFSYPLQDATLYNRESVGVSNEITEPDAVLRVESGRLLVMQTRD